MRNVNKKELLRFLNYQEQMIEIEEGQGGALTEYGQGFHACRKYILDMIDRNFELNTYNFGTFGTPKPKNEKKDNKNITTLP